MTNKIEEVKKILRHAPLWEYDVERLSKQICRLSEPNTDENFEQKIQELYSGEEEEK